MELGLLGRISNTSAFSMR